MSEMNVRTAPEYLGLRAKHTQLKVEHAALQGEVERLKAEVASAKSEVETAKTKYDDSKLKAEIQELKGKLRTTEHRKVFDRLAKERGVAEDVLDDLWQPVRRSRRDADLHSRAWPWAGQARNQWLQDACYQGSVSRLRFHVYPSRRDRQG
jgi:chromosome segregation ATPase